MRAQLLGLTLLCVAPAGCLEKIDAGRRPFSAPSSTGGDPVTPTASADEDLAQAQTGDLATTSPSDMARPPVSMMMEAESGTLTAPMAAVADANASGGNYIAVPVGQTGGSASFSITIAQAGTYHFWGRAAGPLDTANSFHVTLDTETVDNDAADNVSTIWDLAVDANLTWQRVNRRNMAGNTNLTANLTAGAHTLVVTFREADARLDKLFLTDSATLMPPP